MGKLHVHLASGEQSNEKWYTDEGKDIDLYVFFPGICYILFVSVCMWVGDNHINAPVY
jgi:hypothetical protein